MPGGGSPPKPRSDQLLSAPDLDECAFPGVCPSGVCTNTAGSFSCRDCDQGYRPSPLGHTCEGESPPQVRRAQMGYGTLSHHPPRREWPGHSRGCFQARGTSVQLGWWLAGTLILTPPPTGLGKATADLGLGGNEPLHHRLHCAPAPLGQFV